MGQNDVCHDVSHLFLDQTSFQMVQQMGCQYVNCAQVFKMITRQELTSLLG